MRQEEEVYFVTDSAGQQVNVCFEPLTGNDSSALEGDDWQGAQFGEVWKAWAEHEVALKLVRCDGSDKSILGVVKIGTVRRANNRGGYLRDSLLETAPVYRHDMKARRYRGIGRVLVARLVAESKAQGAEGR